MADPYQLIIERVAGAAAKWPRPVAVCPRPSPRCLTVAGDPSGAGWDSSSALLVESALIQVIVMLRENPAPLA